MSGKLSVVATPIGNLEDITLRALRVLKEADVVYAEDTRVAGRLLGHFDIETPVRRLDAFKEKDKAPEVAERILRGERVAYITDAGTPGISDPGGRLVALVRAHAPDAVVETVPGASAVTAALSIAGISADDFLFLGFLPHKKGRVTALKYIAQSPHTVVLYESPHRIEKLLRGLREVAPQRRVTLARELTKMYEEVVTGTPDELLLRITDDPQKKRGEFVVIIAAE
ncbi:16S rRNA (cytidine(1402)-2'-O)-methyltransferase [Candidatus Kaiserbacteria bacterium]|nr:16S rRNA (cytidine(1402)-2'-O)-methyltransferase [Candidatus Kaiserbacteria bacterium]